VDATAIATLLRLTLGRSFAVDEAGADINPAGVSRPHPTETEDRSDLNQLKCRVEALELDAGVGGSKAPIRFDVMSVALA
jgi:hypothetical protein